MATLKEFQEKGLLWAINREVLHPRGYALTLEYDKDGNVFNWFIQGKGTEIWAFDQETDDSGFERFNKFLKELSNG